MDFKQYLVMVGAAVLMMVTCCFSSSGEQLYVSSVFVTGFTSGIEGPAVDGDGNLYAVNYSQQGTIGKVTPDGQASVFVTLPTGSIGNGIRFNSQGDMLIADYPGHHVLKVNMQTKAISVYGDFTNTTPSTKQPNDVAIMDNDIVFASDPNFSADSGQIWRVDTNGTVTNMENGMGETNGIEVSPDNQTLYVNESNTRKVWAYDLSATGQLSNKRLFHQFNDAHGMDGMRCDVMGNLYVTRYGKGVVAMLSPTGQFIRDIQLIGDRPSNIAFGGVDGKTAYVTLADKGHVESFLVEFPGRAYKPNSKVINRKIFYNNSSFDEVDDVHAIATDKQALLPGQTASFVNYTNYDKGINGIMVDVIALAGSVSASDFEFKVGNDSNVASWTAGPAPTSLDVYSGEGEYGSDRIVIIFADGAIMGQWLQVKILANAQTGLNTADVFYFGNAPGETGNAAGDSLVDAADEIEARNHPRHFVKPAEIDDVNDFNRDQKVDAEDQILARNHNTDFTNKLRLINVP